MGKSKASKRRRSLPRRQDVARDCGNLRHDFHTPASRKRYPYFAYGSNLNVRDMEHRTPDAVRGPSAVLKGWRLTFRGVADVEPREGDEVQGGVWWVSADDIRRLDGYEGFPDFYGRTFVTVETSGGAQKCFTYRMNMDDGRYRDYEGLPTPGYYRTVAEGFKAWGLPMGELERALDETRRGHSGVSRYRPDGPKRMKAVHDGAPYPPRTKKAARRERRMKPVRERHYSPASERRARTRAALDSYDTPTAGMSPATRRLWELEMRGATEAPDAEDRDFMDRLQREAEEAL